MTANFAELFEFYWEIPLIFAATEVYSLLFVVLDFALQLVYPKD